MSNKATFIRNFGIAAALALSAQAAVADDIYVSPTTSGSGVTVTINQSNCWAWAPCTIDAVVNTGLDAISAMLGVGESFEFDFFDLVLGGLGEISDATISATLAFISPDIAPVASGDGSFFTFFGIISGAQLTWDQPELVSLGDGTHLQIEFEDVSSIVWGSSVTVRASVGRIGSEISAVGGPGPSVRVPEPGTLALFGLGLIALGMLRRRLPGIALPQ